MLRRLTIALTLAGSLLATGVSSDTFAKRVEIDKAWTRASVAPGRPTAAYMTIKNTSDEDIVLIGIRTDVAMMAEIHVTETDANGVSGMRPAGPVVIKADAMATLEPGGLHLMLMKLKAPLSEGEMIQLVLEFEDGSEVAVDAAVMASAATGMVHGN